MTELRIPADNFQVGDFVHTDDGRFVEVRSIERGDLGELTVNPGEHDQMDGKVWQHAIVTRNA